MVAASDGAQLSPNELRALSAHDGTGGRGHDALLVGGRLLWPFPLDAGGNQKSALVLASAADRARELASELVFA